MEKIQILVDDGPPNVGFLYSGRVALLTPDACPMTLDEIGIGRAWLAEGTVQHLQLDSTVDQILYIHET